jgi:hypothetical protein
LPKLPQKRKKANIKSQFVKRLESQLKRIIKEGAFSKIKVCEIFEFNHNLKLLLKPQAISQNDRRGILALRESSKNRSIESHSLLPT